MISFAKELSIMEKVELKVTGMSCTNCALSINKYLKEQIPDSNKGFGYLKFEKIGILKVNFYSHLDLKDFSYRNNFGSTLLD